MNCAYSNSCWYQISVYADKFDFLDHICPKRLLPIKSRKCEHHQWILHIRISLGTKFQLKLIIMTFWTKFAQKGYFRKRKNWTALLNSEYSNWARCYGSSRRSKRKLTVYGTSRSRAFNKNAMALLGQSRDSWPSMAPLGHVELTKMQKLLESKNKIQNGNEKPNENKSENSFLFSFSFLF